MSSSETKGVKLSVGGGLDFKFTVGALVEGKSTAIKVLSRRSLAAS